MNPSMKTVMRTRYWVRFAWRLGAVCVMIWALWSARYHLMSVVRAPFQSGGGPFAGQGPGISYWLVEVVSTFVAYGLIAAAMLLTERVVVRWLAPNPYRGCGNCGYPTVSAAGRCPECGTEMTSAAPE